CGKDLFKKSFPYMMPYIFKLAASPHLAALKEKKNISAAKIKNSLKKLESRYEVVVIEGAGGLFVPLNRKWLLIDVIKDLNIPVLLVAANRLGTINHTLLSIEAVKTRKIPFLGAVINNTDKKENPVIVKDNPHIISAFYPKDVLGVIPWRKNTGSLKRVFKGIGDKIAQRFK
ncbi:MAG: dethiobiotin synthase, partial [bacterium]